jgi:hypothetical protein
MSMSHRQLHGTQENPTTQYNYLPAFECNLDTNQ